MKTEPKFCDQCGAKLVAGMCTKCPGQRKPFEVRPFEKITQEAKELFLDRVYKMCVEHAHGHFTGNCLCGCECSHWIYEEAMRCCLGDDVFKKINNPKEFYWPETP